MDIVGNGDFILKFSNLGTEDSSKMGSHETERRILSHEGLHSQLIRCHRDFASKLHRASTKRIGSNGGRVARTAARTMEL